MLMLSQIIWGRLLVVRPCVVERLHFGLHVDLIRSGDAPSHYHGQESFLFSARRHIITDQGNVVALEHGTRVQLEQ